MVNEREPHRGKLGMDTAEVTRLSTASLGRDAMGLAFDKLSLEDIHWAKISIVDTFGVMLAGAVEPTVGLLARALDQTYGRSRIYSTGEMANAPDAALINGMAAHVLDFDASSDTFAGHPSVHLLPALIALADGSDLDGQAFISAYVAGFETQSRIAGAIAAQHFEKGWFPTSTIGVFGAAAGAAHLMGLDAGRAGQALSIASMSAAGTVAHAGSMTKPMAAGHSARSGLLAALLAQRGLTAAQEGLVSERGFFELFVGDNLIENASYDPWRPPLAIQDTARGLKQYPCCGIFHAALDVVGDLKSEYQLSEGDVEHISAQLFTSRMGHIDRPHPSNMEDAKFSVQFCLAMMAMKGGIGIDDFDDAVVNLASVRALMARIAVGAHPETDFGAGKIGQGGAFVRVTTRDGKKIGRLCAQATRSRQGQTTFPQSGSIQVHYLRITKPTGA